MAASTKATQDRTDGDLAERYGPAFAKALAVFLKELTREPADGRIALVPAALPDLPDEFQRQAKAEIERNHRLSESGELEGMKFTADSPAIGLANRLRRVIKEQGISQKELANRLHVSPSFVSKVFQDPERSKMVTLRRIAKALGMNLRDVL